jgi:nicotinate-nucleotide--dimethylbenzimidazole phosphoribosyltransferase
MADDDGDDGDELPPFDTVETRPPSSWPADPVFGRAGAAAGWLADRLATGELRRPTAVLIAGDHDGPDDGANLPGPAGLLLTELAHRWGAVVVEHDVATRYATDTQYVVRRGHPDPGTADAADRAEVLAAIAHGRTIADREIDSGADLLIPGLAGRGHGAVLGALVAQLCTLEPVDAVPIPDADAGLWSATAGAVRDATFRIRGSDHDALSLLVAVGGTDLATLAAVIAQAASRRTPVLLDGLAALVAAMLAHRLAPGAEGWFVAASEPTGRPGSRIQEMLAVPAVLNLGTQSWSGSGALLVLPLLQAALAGRPDAR